MWELLGISKSATITGFVGAILAALQGKNRRVFERVLAFGIGFCVAVLGPDLVILWFDMKPTPSLYSALGFFLGYFGYRWTDGVMQLDMKEIASSWLKKS